MLYNNEVDGVYPFQWPRGRKHRRCEERLKMWEGSLCQSRDISSGPSNVSQKIQVEGGKADGIETHHICGEG